MEKKKEGPRDQTILINTSTFELNALNHKKDKMREKTAEYLRSNKRLPSFRT